MKLRPLVLPAFQLSLALLAGCLLAPSIASGQIQRYELGKRLQRFELAWQEADEENRAASAIPMSDAVRCFFGGQFTEAAKQLDTAWHTVRGVEPDAFERNAIALGCRFLPSASDIQRPEIQIQVAPFYDIDELPESTNIEWSVVDPTNGKVVASGQKLLAEALADGWVWRPRGLSAADYHVSVRVTNGQQTMALTKSAYSHIENFDERLADLEQALKGLRGQLDDSLFTTARDLSRVLRSLHTGEVRETDYPANQLLELAELVVAEPERARQQVRQQARQTDVWLTLARKRKRVPVRVRAPASTESGLPVLFLFHGAGGSENMFFETCGAGRCVTLGLQRGWLVVAPRQISGRLALDCSEMLDELEKFFNVDRSRVFLVGHSMGGGQVVRQVALNPDLARGAVVLGGGGQAEDFAQLASTPWFVAAGELDFGRRGALALSRNLQEADAQAEFLEFKSVEHMVIVQAATDELFQFLDRVNVD